MRGFIPLYLVALTASGCVLARTDARVRHGFQVGVAAAEAWTPDAETDNADSFLTGEPEHNDASNLRGFGELQVRYGFERVDVTLHAPALAWSNRSDYVYGGHRYFFYPGQLDLFVDAIDSGAWHVGAGVSTSLAAQVVFTRELSSAAAVSLTGAVSVNGLQAQASFVYATASFDVTTFVSAVDPGWRNDRRFYLGKPCFESCDSVTAGTFGLLGVSVMYR
jgi:hypothetical protein